MTPLRFDVITTFPEMFNAQAPGALGVSIPARAREAGLVEWHAHNLREHTSDKNGRTDDRPFGGGPGMVMSCQPVYDAVRAVEALDPRPARRVLLTPQGVPMRQPMVERLASEQRLVLIAGHYEGIDERVIERLAPLEVSVGDYVLSGGEVAAIVLMDAVIRMLPGALGHGESAGRDSFSRVEATDSLGQRMPAKLLRELGLSERSRLLDCPHYTRPREWDGMAVPDVLLEGDHAAVARWRLEQSLRRTRDRRPDLLKEAREND